MHDCAALRAEGSVERWAHAVCGLCALWAAFGALIAEAEVHGPASFEEWEQCFRVWAIGMVGVKAIRLGAALKYQSHLRRYNSRYSASVWNLVYQADVRCRRELLERLHRNISAQIAEAEAVSTATADEVARAAGFNRSMPWDYCIRMAMADQAWWQIELVEPAMLVLSRSGSLRDMVGGDAPTGGNTIPGAGVPNMGNSNPHKRPPPAGGHPLSSAAKNPRPNRPQAGQRVHQVAGGLFTANRKGVALCSAFQSGQCAGQNCPQGLAHQCAKCLEQRHGANACTGQNRAGTPPKGGVQGRG